MTTAAAVTYSLKGKSARVGMCQSYTRLTSMRPTSGNAEEYVIITLRGWSMVSILGRLIRPSLLTTP